MSDQPPSRSQQQQLPLGLNPSALEFTPASTSQTSNVCLQQSSMPIEQVNAQRICGPPFGYFGPVPSQEAEVFVRNIPKSISEAELLELFGRIGQIYKLRVMTNMDGSNRGIAFLHYFTKSAAKQAIYYFKNYTLPTGDVISMVQSRNNRRIVITGLPEHISYDTVRNEVFQLTQGVTSVKLFEFNPNQGRKAIIKYESHEVALRALRKVLMGGTIAQSPIYAEWARPPRTETDESED